MMESELFEEEFEHGPYVMILSWMTDEIFAILPAWDEDTIAHYFDMAREEEYDYWYNYLFTGDIDSSDYDRPDGYHEEVNLIGPFMEISNPLILPMMTDEIKQSLEKYGYYKKEM
jgi:hypothetical protein